MFGISNFDLLFIIGVSIVLIGPKELPRVGRKLGLYFGKSVAHIQIVRGHFDNVMQQSQARQVHKELQDTMAQLDAIRFELRGLSMMNPGPMTKNLMDKAVETSPEDDSGNGALQKLEKEVELKKRIDTILKGNGLRNSGPVNLHEKMRLDTMSKDNSLRASESVNLHAQATSYEKLAEAEAEALKAASYKENVEKLKLGDESGLFAILPVSAESAKILPIRTDSTSGSDLVLEAVIEAEVAHKAKDYFAQAQNNLPEK